MAGPTEKRIITIETIANSRYLDTDKWRVSKQLANVVTHAPGAALQRLAGNEAMTTQEIETDNDRRIMNDLRALVEQKLGPNGTPKGNEAVTLVTDARDANPPKINSAQAAILLKLATTLDTEMAEERARAALRKQLGITTEIQSLLNPRSVASDLANVAERARQHADDLTTKVAARLKLADPVAQDPTQAIPTDTRTKLESLLASELGQKGKDKTAIAYVQDQFNDFAQTLQNLTANDPATTLAQAALAELKQLNTEINAKNFFACLVGQYRAHADKTTLMDPSRNILMAKAMMLEHQAVIAEKMDAPINKVGPAANAALDTLLQKDPATQKPLPILDTTVLDPAKLNVRPDTTEDKMLKTLRSNIEAVDTAAKKLAEALKDNKNPQNPDVARAVAEFEKAQTALAENLNDARVKVQLNTLATQNKKTQEINALLAQITHINNTLGLVKADLPIRKTPASLEEMLTSVQNAAPIRKDSKNISEEALCRAFYNSTDCFLFTFKYDKETNETKKEPVLGKDGQPIKPKASEIVDAIMAENRLIDARNEALLKADPKAKPEPRIIVSTPKGGRPGLDFEYKADSKERIGAINNRIKASVEARLEAEAKVNAVKQNTTAPTTVQTDPSKATADGGADATNSTTAAVQRRPA